MVQGTCKWSSHSSEPIADKLFSIDVMQLLQSRCREQFICEQGANDRCD